MLLTEQHRAYLNARVSAKPGEEQTLFAHFKCPENEIIKLNGAAMNQKAADDVKSMLQDLEAHLTKKRDDKLSNVGAVMVQQNDRVEERLKTGPLYNV